MKSRLKMALVGVMLSGAVVSGQQAVQSPTAAGAARQASGAAASGRTGVTTKSLITGTALDTNAAPLPNATVRLRNLQSNEIEHVVTTNPRGEFSFSVQPEIPYVVEIADQSGRVIAVSDVIIVQSGEVAGAAVAIPTRVPALAGVFGETVGSVVSAATGAGLTVVDPARQKLSPTE